MRAGSGAGGEFSNKIWRRSGNSDLITGLSEKSPREIPKFSESTTNADMNAERPGKNVMTKIAG
jgi:hypothetical protein